ncbi:FAD-dependent thymidylate synthase [Bacillus solitudinis]|uniref:FAD-dependent thymidylate synthase n=1 Tax=Bacillus solitudinis TaxID=2014074 RepID=UPI000C234BFE|nr:FAD-dependent thymidylate synthase [Bacillus solitudinis]
MSITIIGDSEVREYQGDTFLIRMTRYSDPERKNAARNAARYLGKSDLDNVRRPLSIIKQGHVPEVFRGEFVEFEFEDVSKEVYDHIITYTTRNMRVAGGNRALTSDDYTLPSDKVKDINRIDSAVLVSMTQYNALLERGETPQVARSAMPIAAKLNTFVYQFNFLTLMQAVFKQRIWEKGAQGNTVKVIQGMFELVHSVDPELWDTAYEWFGTPATEWVEVRKKLKKKDITVGEFFGMLEHERFLGQANEASVFSQDLEEFLKFKFGQQKSMWD